MSRPRIAVALGVILLLSACSLDYSQSRLATEIDEETPDSILFEVTHTVVRDGVPRFIVEADRAESFGARRQQLLTGVRFRELNQQGEIVTDGTAQLATYNTDSEDFELSGDLRFFSAEEDALLIADVLRWDSDLRLLTSDPEQPVVVERGDGTAITGRGFVAEMGSSIIRFEEGVSGTLVESSDDESE